MQMKRIVVLGAGLVGKAIAIDLASKYEVTVVDIDYKNLDKVAQNDAIKTRMLDLSDAKSVMEVIQNFDLVVGALPSSLGYRTMEAVIRAGKDMVDISFLPEDALELDELAKNHGVTVVFDCGVAPGMSNIILGYHNSKMKVQKFDCMVGGLPVDRIWPYEYKAPFSPMDVLEEYTRPARIVKNGKIVIKPALSEPEFIQFDKIGTLEAFNTDGLRSLLSTMQVPNMRERTLRYPGHIELMAILRETGFFDKKVIDIKGQSIKPIDLTSKLLFPKWQLHEGDEEFTIMRIEINGMEQNQQKRYQYDLFDKYDWTTRTSSMARTTGYTCTAVVDLVMENLYSRKGVSPPEFIGADEQCFNKIIEYLKLRNVVYQFIESVI
jgi:saccharopine dehydrogenase-like NADP-dependent oxidoreductase